MCEPRQVAIPNRGLPSSIASRSRPVRCEAANAALMAGKKIYGRKRHVLGDTLGLLLAVKVHSAGLVDCRGAPLLLQELRGRFPRLSHLFADSGSTGPLVAWIKRHLGWDTEIVPKPDPWAIINGEVVRLPGGFQVQRHRWKVERTQS